MLSPSVCLSKSIWSDGTTSPGGLLEDRCGEQYWPAALEACELLSRHISSCLGAMTLMEGREPQKDLIR